VSIIGAKTGFGIGMGVGVVSSILKGSILMTSDVVKSCKLAGIGNNGICFRNTT